MHCDTTVRTGPIESGENLAQLECLCRIPVRQIFLQVIGFLKEFEVKYLLNLCVIGAVFSALAGCGESAEAKNTRLQKEALETFQKISESAEKLNNSMKK